MKRIALLTTEGFADMLELGRQNRPNPYALCTPVSPWAQRIPAGLRLQTAGRMNALGQEVIPVDVEAVLRQIDAVIEHIDALAICLLFSWKNPAHEQALAQAIQHRFPQLQLQCSHCFAELTTEYERCLQTVDSLQPEGWPSPNTASHGQAPQRVVTDLALALEDCANHMQAVLVDQAVSSIAKQAMDCAAAIFLPDGRLIAQAHSLPLLLGSLSPAVQALLSVHPATSMQPGDGYVLNHPWMGGTHLPDLTLVRPVFQAGKLIALLACILHHQDVGGMVAGSLPSAATNVHQEGLLIPPVRLFAQEHMLSDMRQLLLANSRTPENFAGDLAAQWSALRAGEPQVQSLQAKWGAKFLSQCEAQIHQSSALARAAIAALPNGLYHYRDALDGDGVVADAIAIDVKLRIQGQQLVIDLRDCADQSIGPANASRGAVQAAITYLARMIEPRCGSDEGCLAPIEVLLRPGSIVDPTYPAAINARTNLLKVLVNAMLGALAQAQPQQFPAPNAGSAVVLSLAGTRADDSRWMFTEIIASGAGATPWADGAAAVSTDISNARSTPAEVLEQQAPLYVETVCIRRGSGGDGMHRGGDGVLRRYRLLEGQATLSYRGERHSIAPQGCLGGHAGQPAQAFVLRANGERLELAAKSTATLYAGDTLTIATAGAGGWGSPPTSH